MARYCIAALALVAAFTASISFGQPEPGTWTQIAHEDGIKVWRLDIPGKDLPGFRGETVIPRSLADVIEELKQVEHHTEWMHRCAASITLRRLNEEHAIIYNRTDVPWPIWDRDVVLDTRFQWQPDRRLVTLTFKHHDSKLRPIPERVVRMPRLEGFYKLSQLTAASTNVVYQVEADVGGSVPKWIAARVAREMPYETLSRLRERVVSRHGAD